MQRVTCSPTAFLQADEFTAQPDFSFTRIGYQRGDKAELSCKNAVFA
jgi:hypothetical protein